MIEESINVVLFENRYPKLKIRIAVDAGENQIVVLGSDPDLLGHVISRAAKIMGKGKPNQIVIGDKVFNNINSNLKKKFQQAESFILHETKESYAIYLSKGNN
jgi:adenylate cyclase